MKSNRVGVGVWRRLRAESALMVWLCELDIGLIEFACRKVRLRLKQPRLLCHVQKLLLLACLWPVE